jgi:DNA-binding XRE family transcriptional regulator
MHLSQSEMADMIGVSKRTLQLWESGDSEIPLPAWRLVVEYAEKALLDREKLISFL